MSCNVKEIAQYIVNYFIIKDNPVTNLKLQKLLYFAWIDYFKYKKEHLFEEDFEAWVLGPVVPIAYYEYCTYGADMIFRQRKTDITVIDTNILDNILDNYSDSTGYDLVNKSHRKGGAWDKVYQNGKGRKNKISFDIIKKLEC